MARMPKVATGIEAITDVFQPSGRRLRWCASLPLVAFAVASVFFTARLQGGDDAPKSSGQDPTADRDQAASQGAADEAPATAPLKEGLDIYGDPLPEGAIARLGTVRYRHPGWYKRMAFLSNGESFVVKTEDTALRSWNARTGRLQREVDLGELRMAAFCLSPGRKSIAVLAHDLNPKTREYQNRVVVYELPSWAEKHRFEWKTPLAEAPAELAVSGDGNVIATGGGNGKVQLRDLATGQELLQYQVVKGKVESIAFSPGADLLAVAGQQEVALWEFATDREPHKLSGLSRGGQVVRFSPDGTLLVVGGRDDRAAHIFDVTTRRLLHELKGKNEHYYREGLCFTADGKQLIVPAGRGNEGGAIEMFSVETGQLERRLETGGAEPRDCGISHDGRLLASVGSNAAMRVWDLQTGERISDRFVGHLESPYEIAFTPDDRYVVTGGMDGKIYVWDAAAGRQVRVMSHDHWVAGMAVSRDGRRIVSCGLDESVRLWDAVTGKQLYKLYGHGRHGGNATYEVAFSSDGKRFLSFGPDLYLRVCSVRNGKCLAEHAIRPSGLALKENEDGTLQLAEGGGPFPGDGVIGAVSDATFTSDASLLLLTTQGKLYAFDVETGQELDVFRTEDRRLEFQISPDGKILATLEQAARRQSDNTGNATSDANEVPKTFLRLRGFADKKIIHETDVPGKYARLCVFSPDGKRIAFTAYDNPTRNVYKRWISVYDVATLDEVARIDGLREQTHRLAFSHDGAKLAASQEDSTVLIWDLARFRTKAAASR